jgi:VanZ family protein
MSEPAPPAKTWLIPVIMMAVILYGSLYPFEFRIPPNGIGPLPTFLRTWHEPPGRGDVLANILLYMPLGFFVRLGFRRGVHLDVALFLSVLAGSLLSLSIELTQYYDATRITAVSDWYSNTLGTVLGAIAARAVGTGFRVPLVGEVSGRPIPTLLILAWLSYRMYPYVPTIDLHKYWDALKPIVLTPSLSAYDLFRQTAIWLTLYALIEAIVGHRRSALLAWPFAIAVLCAKVLIISLGLRMAELAGASLAFVVWCVLLMVPVRPRAGIAVLVLSAYVAAQRLEPFEFQAIAHPFGWIPFQGFMHGSVQVDTLVFLEKFFLYGSMLYLLGTALGRRVPATVLVASLLFATSWAEIYLPFRSAEITDGLMALMLAVIFALLPPEHETQATREPPPRNAHEQRLREWQREQARSLGVKIDG